MQGSHAKISASGRDVWAFTTGGQKLPRAYLGLGSNLGDKHKHLDEARRQLEGSQGISVLKVSSYRQTEPVGGPPQDNFLNAAAEIETTLAPEKLLKRCLEIETTMGRRREARWGPRAIDIDILIYDMLVFDSLTLKIPHPLMHLRRFVLEPLSELAPDLLHPAKKMTMLQLLRNLPNQSEQKKR